MDKYAISTKIGYDAVGNVILRNDGYFIVVRYEEDDKVIRVDRSLYNSTAVGQYVDF